MHLIATRNTVVLAILLGGVPGFPVWAGESSDYDKALVAIEHGKYKEAVRLLDPICARTPDDIHVRSARACARFSLNDMKGVIEDYEAILAMPDIPDEYPMSDTLQILTSAYLKAGNHSKALQYANRAIEEDREDAGAFHARAYVYASLGCLRSALRDCQEGLKRCPDDLGLLEVYADLHGNMKDYPKAIAAFERVMARMRTKADQGRLYAKRGFCYLKFGRLESARSDLELAIGLCPSDPSIHCVYGDVLFKLQEPKKAAEAWRRANELRSSVKPGQRIALDARYVSKEYIENLVEKAESRKKMLQK